MLTSPKKFKVNEIVYFLQDGRINSGKIMFIQHPKEDIRDSKGNLIVRSIMNNEYFVCGKWRKESEIHSSPEPLISA